jgi:hypothetical protein
MHPIIYVAFIFSLLEEDLPFYYAPPPFEEEGHIALHLSVGMSVSR